MDSYGEIYKNNDMKTPESSNYRNMQENILKHEVTLTPEEFE